MNKIVVAKLVRLGKDGDNFSKKMIAKEERTNAKVDVDYIKEFNANWKASGRLYIVDDKLTKERDEILKGNTKNVDPKKEAKVEDKTESPELIAAKEKYTKLFGKAPHVAAKIDTILKKIEEKEKEPVKLTLDQLKERAKELELEFDAEITEEDLIKLIEEKEKK